MSEGAVGRTEVGTSWGNNNAGLGANEGTGDGTLTEGLGVCGEVGTGDGGVEG